MKNNTETKLQLRTKPPKPTTVNKPLVLGISAVLALIVLIAIISALTISKVAKDDSLEIADGSNANLAASKNDDLLKNLPQDYSDINSIRKYSRTGNDSTIKELQSELNTLKEQDESLRDQVSKLVQHPEQIKRVSNMEDQQAKNSGMFFSGIGPQTEGIGIKPLDGGQSSPAAAAAGSKTSTADIQLTADDFKAQKLSPMEQLRFYGDKNKQKQVAEVLKAADNSEDIYDLHNMVTPASPYEIQAGTIIPATLITGINTSLSGTVVAQVRRDMYDTVTGKYLLLPKGAKIIGEYDARVAYGQRRVLIAFNRVIRPDGSSILLGKPFGSDLQGQAGMEGDVNNHWAKILGAATLSTILSVGAGVTADNSGNNNTYYTNSKQNAILGASSSISQTGQTLTNRAIDIAPTITVPSGFQFNIIVKKDMILNPFKRKTSNE